MVLGGKGVSVLKREKNKGENNSSCVGESHILGKNKLLNEHG